MSRAYLIKLISQETQTKAPKLATLFIDLVQ